MNAITIASYTLDTLQIYFAWDDDLYTYLKEKGFGQGGFNKKTLPIIYSDNCESTTGVKERRRKNVINPKFFGKTYEELGWKRTDIETEPIIPSEKPMVTISLNDDILKFKINPQVNGKEQYHLEYSTMAAFGRLYTNWAIPVLRIDDFKNLISCLRELLSIPTDKFVDATIHIEEKQAQRERMFFVKVPITFYKFSIGEFQYAKDFLLMNGFKGKIPSLVFKNEKSYLEKMEPILKVGFVHTTEEQGFEFRKPQIALKIAQDKITTSLRGKRTKVKGIITLDEVYENYFEVPAKIFTFLSEKLLKKITETKI
ncbi:MAG: hypothetical protein QXV21_05545 [Candidatus Bathyarchaeia archaeon]